MRKILGTIIKILVAAGIIWYLFSRVNWNLFFNSFKNVNIYLIIISMLALYLGVYFSILRWNVFLKNYNFKISKLKLYSLYSIGTFFNNFLPTTIGGDVYKFVSLNKHFKEKRKEIISSLILDRGSGFLILFLINIALAPLFYRLITFDRRFLFLEISIFSGFIIILFFIINFQFLFRIEKLIKKEIPLFKKFNQLVVSLSSINNKKTLIHGAFYSILFFLVSSGIAWIQFYAFGVEINFFYILLVSSVTLILGVLPISFNSIGITEGLNVFLFGCIGVPVEICLAVTIVGRVSLMVISSLGGIFYFFDRKIKY
jgi:hypothetical protein